LKANFGGPEKSLMSLITKMLNLTSDLKFVLIRYQRLQLCYGKLSKHLAAHIFKNKARVVKLFTIWTSATYKEMYSKEPIRLSTTETPVFEYFGI
jgi:hypothetical protein